MIHTKLCANLAVPEE